MNKTKTFLTFLILILTAGKSFAIMDTATGEMFETMFKPTNQIEVKEVKVEEEKDEQKHGSLPPIKKLRLMMKYKKAMKDLPQTAEISTTEMLENSQAILDCDEMEYFAQRKELEAIGNVVMFFPKNNATIKADKLIYNQDSNLVKAFDNVVIIKDGTAMNGDYLKIDMNEENAFMDNPNSDLFQVKIRSKTGHMYGDKIIQEQGSLYVAKNTMIKLRSEMFGPDLDQMLVKDEDKTFLRKKGDGSVFKIKTNEIILNSSKDHDTVTMKKAHIMYNGKNVGTWPSITFHTNKAQDYVEGNYPEFGSMSKLGMFIGPGFVFDTPRGSTLKVVPMLNYDAGKFGFGGIAKYKSATNKTDIAYGTAGDTLLISGKQRLDDNLYIQYGANRFVDDWFLGYRRAKYMGELVYRDTKKGSDLFKKGLDTTYSHRASAGFMQDTDIGGYSEKFKTSGGIGTARFKYMAELNQQLYKYEDVENLKKVDLSLVFQGSAAMYGTGDTQFVGRVGPRLHTQYKYWMQDIGYFQSAYHDGSPMVLYDRYMYGRSNVYLRESFRVHKYLTLSWLASMNLSGDSWNDNLFQENAFFFSIGPDDIKLNLGYDVVRQQTYFTMAMNMDAKGSVVDYQKMTIKNPDKLGNPNDDSYLFMKEPTKGPVVLEKANVLDIKESL